MPESLTVLGFDPGTHWIGSAVGQTRTATASPLQPVAVIANQPDWPSIARLIDEWRPDRLIVGYPRRLDDSPTDMTARAARFCRQLQGRFGIRCELIDERLTTREAWQIVEEHAQGRQSKPQIDSVAAVLITETWLHEHA